MPQGHTCGFCGETLPTASGLRHHVQRKAPCAEAFHAQRAQRLQQINTTLDYTIVTNFVELLDYDPFRELNSAADSLPSSPALDELPDPNPGTFGPAPRAPTAGPDELYHGLAPGRSPSVEEVEDEGEPWQRTYQERYTEPYRSAGKPRDDTKHPTVFEQLRDKYGLQGDSAYGPFGDRDSWEIGRFAMKQLSRGGTATFLGLGKVRQFIESTNDS